MKKLAFVLLLFPVLIFSQGMTNEKLNEIYTSMSDSIEGNQGRWNMYINDVIIISITDTNNNRMRIISPIIESDRLDDNLIKAALVANFHTALDVKYAVSDGILWSVFTHPLKELTDHQVDDAVSQVYYANANFGTTYSSSSLSFPINTGNIKDKEKPKKIKRKTSKF